MTSANDKLRNKMARENLTAAANRDGTVFKMAADQHLEKIAFAPDMVKWSKKDIRKLMNERKAAEAD